MKGILLAGGSGTRLAPMTAVVSKQLLPIYDKPMLYYPLSLLMLAGIRDILVISTPHDLPLMRALLGDGKSLGLSINYREQQKPEGIPQAFIIAEEFLAGDSACLVLGDNILYGHGLEAILAKAAALTKGAYVFAYHVRDPERYGVIEMDTVGNIKAVTEKPKKPKSPLAMTGIYFCDNRAGSIAKSLKPSARGELEITDLCNDYLSRGELKASVIGRGIAWLDTGLPDSLLSASHFVQTVEIRQGLKVACIEEIALHKSFIDEAQFERLIESYGQNDYRTYLERILNERRAHAG